MRILFVCHYYPPEIGGGATRFTWLTRNLKRQGHTLTVLTGMPNYPSGVIPEAYRRKLLVREQISGVEVLRGAIVPAAYNSRLRRLINYLSLIVSATLIGLFLKPRFDALIAAMPPPFVGVPGYLLARRFRIPWVYDLGDLWPEVAIEAGEMRSDSTSARLLFALSRFLYHRADHLVPVTQAKRDKLIQAGIPAERITIVENGIDLQELAEIIPDRHQDSGRSEFVVGYAGLIGIAQGVERCAEAAHLLSGEDIRFMIMGDGVRRAYLEQEIERLSLTSIDLHAPRSRPEALAALNKVDVIWVPLLNESIDDAVPSKLLEAWGLRKPVILSAGGEAARIVREASGGIVTAPGDAQALADAITTLRDDPALRQQFAADGHAYVSQHFSANQLAARMADVAERLR